jgi:gliding motility-associated-like protein
MKKLSLIIILFFTFKSNQLLATHIMGGSLTYVNMGYDLQNRTADYLVSLTAYRSCDSNSATFQPSSITICYDSSLTSFNGKPIYRFENFTLAYTEIINPPALNVSCTFLPNVCVEKGYYEAYITLPIDTAFHVFLFTGNRNNSILNISNGDTTSITFYTLIPALISGSQLNSSPEINDLSVPYVCAGDTISYNCNAFDADGDSLVYSFVHPSGSGANFMGGSYSPYLLDTLGDPFAVKYPVDSVIYNPGFSYLFPFGAGGSATIDRKTGLSKFYIPFQGYYVVAVEIKEYRNGIFISRVRRDIQLIVLACPPNQSPKLQAGSVPSFQFNITEQDTLCFNLTFYDTDSDKITLAAVGSLFNSASVNPPAVLNSVSGDSIATASFCWMPICGQARTEPYQFTISATDDGCPPKFSEYIFEITVDSFTQVLTPMVTIYQNPDTAFCTGTNIEFNAVPIHEGLNPLYNWFLNGNKVGINSKTYATNNLLNGDLVNLIMTSSSQCVDDPIAHSNDKVMVAYQSPEAVFTVNPTKQTIFSPQFYFYNQSLNAVSYQWNFGDNIADTTFNAMHNYAGTGIYDVMLIATSNEGCVDTMFTEIVVEDETTLYIPNAFSPNNDGINDTFSFFGNSLSDYDLKIFNRWGQLIFTGSQTKMWDGRFKNKKVPSGSYIYWLKFNDTAFNKTYTGNVNVIR